MDTNVVIEWAIRTKQTFLTCEHRPPAGWNWRRRDENINRFKLVSERGELITLSDVKKASREKFNG